MEKREKQVLNYGYATHALTDNKGTLLAGATAEQLNEYHDQSKVNLHYNY